MDGAFISTIHALCARVIRRHYHAVGLPARARTADEMESAALIETVRDELMTGLSADGTRTTRGARGVRRRAAVWDAVMATYRFRSSRRAGSGAGGSPSPARAYADDAAIRRILDDAGFSAKTNSRSPSSPSFGSGTRCRGLRKRDCHAGRRADALPRMLLCKSHDQYREALAAMEYGRLTFPRSVGKEEKAPVQDARTRQKR